MILRNARCNDEIRIYCYILKIVSTRLGCRTIYKNFTLYEGGPRWHSGKGDVLQIRRSPVLSQFLIDIKSFQSHYGPGVDSASNRNEYQERYLEVKAASA